MKNGGNLNVNRIGHAYIEEVDFPEAPTTLELEEIFRNDPSSDMRATAARRLLLSQSDLEPAMDILVRACTDRDPFCQMYFLEMLQQCAPAHFRLADSERKPRWWNQEWSDELKKEMASRLKTPGAIDESNTHWLLAALGCLHDSHCAQPAAESLIESERLNLATRHYLMALDELQGYEAITALRYVAKHTSRDRIRASCYVSLLRHGVQDGVDWLLDPKTPTNHVDTYGDMRFALASLRDPEHYPRALSMMNSMRFERWRATAAKYFYDDLKDTKLEESIVRQRLTEKFS